MIPRNPAPEAAAFVSAPDMAEARVSAANATARMRRTMAAIGDCILDVIPLIVSLSTRTGVIQLLSYYTIYGLVWVIYKWVIL